MTVYELDVLSVVVVVEVVVEVELSSSMAQDSIRPRVNAKIVGKKRNFSFFI